MVGETRPNSKMSVTFVAGETNFGEHTWRARHTIAARLVTDCFITLTTFMTSIKDVSPCHSTRYVCDHKIMSFDIAVEYVETFGRVDVTFEYYIITTKTLINYLVVSKMFLENFKFWDPRTVSQINTYLL